jgi:hypothetical protein
LYSWKGFQKYEALGMMSSEKSVWVSEGAEKRERGKEEKSIA